MSNKTIERLFQTAAALLVLTAAYFLWAGDHDRVFVFAALGSLSFFIGFRFQVKQRLKELDFERVRESLPDAQAGLGSETATDKVHIPVETNNS